MNDTPIARLTANKPLFCSLILGSLFWLIAFCGVAVNSSSENNPGILWFYAVFSFLVLAGMYFIVCAGLLAQYRVTALSFVAITFTFSVLAIQNLTFKLEPATIVATIGYFLFTFVLFFWMLTVGHLGEMSDLTPRFSSHLANFPRSHDEPSYSQSISRLHSSGEFQGFGTLESINYNIEARAIYSYQGNPADPNEIPFEKGDILYVGETHGKWWPARDSSGRTGTVPSNYLELI